MPQKLNIQELPLQCNGGGGGGELVNGIFTWKHACFCVFMFKIYMKAQKHACFHVFSLFCASLIN